LLSAAEIFAKFLKTRNT